MQRGIWGRTCAAAAIGLAATALPRSASSDGIADGPLQAAFHACAGQPVSIQDRLEALNAANWTIADDTAAAGDLFALAFVAGRSGPFVRGEGNAHDAALAGGIARPLVSRVEPGDEAPTGIVPGGRPANPGAIVAYIREHSGAAVLYYMAPDESAALKIFIFKQSATRSGYFISCTLHSSVPITRADVEDLLPDELGPADLRTALRRANGEEHVITYATTSGYSGKLTYIDASGVSTLETYRSRFNTAASLATVVAFEAENLLLTK
jgi:hypothetical protein